MANGEMEEFEIEVERTGLVTHALTPYNDRVSSVTAEHPTYGKAEIKLAKCARDGCNQQIRVDKNGKYMNGEEVTVQVTHYIEGVSPEELRRKTVFHNLDCAIAGLQTIKDEVDVIQTMSEPIS